MFWLLRSNQGFGGIPKESKANGPLGGRRFGGWGHSGQMQRVLRPSRLSTLGTIGPVQFFVDSAANYRLESIPSSLCGAPNGKLPWTGAGSSTTGQASTDVFCSGECGSLCTRHTRAKVAGQVCPPRRRMATLDWNDTGLRSDLFEFARCGRSKRRPDPTPTPLDL